MRKQIVLIFSFITTSVFAQNSIQLPIEGNGVSVGVEKSHSVVFEYNWEKGFFVGAKHTLVADKVEYQSFRGMSGYRWSNTYISFSAASFVTSDWMTSFWNVGTLVSVNSEFLSKYVRVGTEYVPYYDSVLGLQHGWSVSGEVNIARNISILSELSRKPEYRIAYKRVDVGVKFHVQNLIVVPILEIPIYDGGFHASHSSMVVSMSYSFE